MGNADWAWRRASIGEDGWELESGAARHRHSGDDFPIPTETERRQLRPGQAVRLLFKIEAIGEDGTAEVNVERMWAVVLGRVGDYYFASLDNQPATIEPGHLDRGDEFLFSSEHVIDITDLPRQDLLEQFGSRLQFSENDVPHRLN
jgi:hypothetical protein